MDTLLQDLRYASRTLWRSPAFSVTALVVLALGIGANTTMYTVVRGIALRPLPFDEPERLAFIGELSPAGRGEPIAPANFGDLAQQSRAFEQMAMHRGARFSLTGRGAAESVIGANVSSTFLSVLRVQPQRGRAFLPEDEQPDGVRAAMLSHGGWIRHFSQDPTIVGRTIVLDGSDYMVVGILPPDFSMWDSAVWVAGFDPALLTNRVTRNMGTIGRLADGVSLEQARVELDTIARRLALEYPATNAGWTFRIAALHDAWLDTYRSTSLMLLTAVGLVLLIACSNLANLLLERALARTREVSIRLAMGARAQRIVRQMLTESLLLAGVGGAAGVLAAYWSLRFVVAQIPANTLTQIPGGAGAIRLDWHTLGVAVLVSIGTGVLFGLAPAVRMARVDTHGALREAARGATSGLRGRFFRRTLVIAQVALSAILLIAATLMIQTFWKLRELDRGYDADNALSLSLIVPQTRYREPSQRQAFFTNSIERLRALPGVTHVGGMTLVSARGRPYAAEGQPPASRDAAATAVYRIATPEYFATIGIPLLRGRDFSTADGPNAPAVAIVNQTFARTVWPNEDTLGRRVQLLGPQADLWLTVVGIAGDVKESLDPRYPLHLDPQPTIYRPALQEQFNGMSLFVRTDPDPLTLAGAVRREIAAVDPAIPVMMIQSVRQGVDQSMATPRFNTLLLGGFAALALLLAAVGVYGVIAYSVNQRTHEIGIRMALGAAPMRVLRSVVSEALALALIGVVLGVIGAFGAVRLIAHQLYGVRATDSLAFIVVASMLLIVAMMASVVPARRAAGVDPLIALRQE
jgi:putative ABC transport system permease protein